MNTPLFFNQNAAGGFRTLVPRKGLTVFETVPINRSGTAARLYIIAKSGRKEKT